MALRKYCLDVVLFIMVSPSQSYAIVLSHVGKILVFRDSMDDGFEGGQNQRLKC